MKTMCAEKTKHTPTPWTIGVYDASEDFKSINTHVAVCKPDGSLLATCGPVDAESKADAAFIVRAVNSHEELVQFARNVEAYLAGLGTSRDDAECALLNHAEQTIAKAEGK